MHVFVHPLRSVTSSALTMNLSLSVVPGCGEPMECETGAPGVKQEPPGSPDRELGAEGGGEGMEEGLKGGVEETDDGKKRKRKPYRPGQRAL